MGHVTVLFVPRDLEGEQGRYSGSGALPDTLSIKGLKLNIHCVDLVLVQDVP